MTFMNVVQAFKGSAFSPIIHVFLHPHTDTAVQAAVQNTPDVPDVWLLSASRNKQAE